MIPHVLHFFLIFYTRVRAFGSVINYSSTDNLTCQLLLAFKLKGPLAYCFIDCARPGAPLLSAILDYSGNICALDVMKRCSACSGDVRYPVFSAANIVLHLFAVHHTQRCGAS